MSCMAFGRIKAALEAGNIAGRMVYEMYLGREIDRILTRLERLQRMHRRLPLPPRLDIKIS
jgi:hypothetical protein